MVPGDRLGPYEVVSALGAGGIGEVYRARDTNSDTERCTIVIGGIGMGTFHTRCRIANPSRRSKSARVPKILVDTGSEYTWVPGRLLQRLAIAREKKDVRFVMANGEQITRSVGFAIVHVDGSFTIDEVVFGEPGDLTLLGARTLEGLNLRVDTQLKKLVAAGPVPAAASQVEKAEPGCGKADVIGQA
jgi:predicted aspartyl protease